MDITPCIMLGAFGMTASIALASMVCTLHGNVMRRAEHALNVELQREKLAEQRTADQQASEVKAAKFEAEAKALQYMSTEIRKALETQKASQVVVQR